METNCEMCVAEIEDDAVQCCEGCELDGLCMDCYVNHDCVEDHEDAE